MENNRESDLIKLIKKEDINAFEKIFNLYYSQLCEYSYLITRETIESEDIVQNIFIDLWTKIKDKEITSLKSYLFKAVHNNSLRYVTRKKIKVGLTDEIAQPDELSYNYSTNPEMHEKLYQYINELPNRCKEIFVLNKIDNIKQHEIAKKLGISAKTVEVQIRKAKIILKKKLKDYAGILNHVLIVLLG